MNKYNPKIKYIKDIYDYITGESLEDILQRYDNTELKRKVEVLRNEFNTLLNDNPSQAIENFNEIIAFLKNIDDDESLEGIIAGIEQQIAEINNDVDSIIEQHTTDVNNINDKIDAIKSSKVDKISGKQLSTNDYTTSEKNKLSDLPTNEELTQELETKANKNDVEEALEEKLNANTANTLFNQKVDKVEGKQLSTEDFTSFLKDKLEGLTNYDDTELTQQLNLLKERLDILVGSNDATSIIDTFVEIENFLKGITNTKTLTGLLQEMKNEIVALIPNNIIKYYNLYSTSGPQDLNDIVIPGQYRLKTQSSIANLPPYNNNLEAYNDGNMLVVRGGSGSDTLAQVIFPYKKNIPIIYRTGNPLKNGGNGSWNPWKTLLDSDTPYVTTNTVQDITSSKRYYTNQCFCNTAPDGGSWTGNMANGFTFYKNNVISSADDDVLRFGVMTSRSVDSEGNYNITSRRFVFGYGATAYDPNNGCLFDISKDSVHFKNNTVLHSGNYSTYALPRSGGDVTSSINIKYDTDTARYRYYAFKDTKGNITASIGFMNTEKRVYINPIGTAEPWNDVKGNYSLRIGENTLTYNTYKVWHSGNMGSGSGLNADLLDGHNSGYEGNNIPFYTNFPSKATLYKQGYLESSTTTDLNAYLKGILKWAANVHAGHMLMGRIIPAASYNVFMFIYNSGKGSDGNGGTDNRADADFPRYSYGIAYTINGQVSYFGTYDGVYKNTFNFETSFSRRNSIYREYTNDLLPSFIKKTGNSFSLHRVSYSANGIFPISGTGSDTSVIMTLNRASATTGLYISQLGFSSNGELYYKSTNNKSYAYNQEWAKLLTDKNYSTVLDDVYVKKSDYDALLARIETLENK